MKALFSTLVGIFFVSGIFVLPNIWHIIDAAPLIGWPLIAAYAVLWGSIFVGAILHYREHGLSHASVRDLPYQ